MPVVDIASVVRHRGPMLLLDKVVSVGSNSLIATVDIDEHSSFCRKPQGVPAWIGMEYMAQAIAAFGGVGALDRGEELPLGLLIGCQKYSTSVGYFPIGSRLQVEIVENVADTYGLGAFDCSISADRILVTGRLSVFVQPASKLDELLA
jgi:predicted hotdog family 3-hydroxylacyl-ACP dehydratase